MENVETIALHRLGSELLIELIGVDEYGEVATETISWDLANAESTEVTPRDEIPADLEEAIRTVLSEKGYSVAER